MQKREKKCYILRSKKIINFLVVAYHPLTTRGQTIRISTQSVKGIQTAGKDSAPHGFTEAVSVLLVLCFRMQDSMCNNI